MLEQDYSSDKIGNINHLFPKDIEDIVVTNEEKQIQRQKEDALRKKAEAKKAS